MSIKVQRGLPVKAILEEENILIVDEDRATSQDTRPLEILILNLMPLKEETETRLMWASSNTPLQVDCTFLMLPTHVPKNTSASHFNKFYVTSDDIKKKKFNGMITTGASVKSLEYEEVNYWSELSMMMEWSKTRAAPIIHICWGVQAGLYYHYGIPKYPMEKKLSGICDHRVLDRKAPLVRSFNDFFLAPRSRYTWVRKADILKHPELAILAEPGEAGVFLVMSWDGKQIFVQGRPEYDRMTLNNKYHRDLNKGLNPEAPHNYYEDNDPFLAPSLTWRNTSNMLYTNWLNYYVYQATSYLLGAEEWTIMGRVQDRKLSIRTSE